MLKITIIYDNTSINKDLKADWGFAALIKSHQKTMLFDTGGDGEILLRNMRVLNIIPESISDVFISHSHFDHIGGLSHFLNKNSNITLHAPHSFRGVKKAREVKYYDKPQQIFPHFYTTGELEKIEQALAVETEYGLMVITGCSHPDLKNTLQTLERFGRIYGIVGGLHGFNQYELLKDLHIICPTHCTQHIREIKKRFPDKYVQGGAGTLIEI